MDSSLEDVRVKFKQVFANLPEKIRNEDILLVLNDNPYTWNAIFLEVSNNTPLGDEMLKKLLEMKLL